MPDDLPPTPLLPQPKSRADQINWLRLIRSRRVGPATFLRLLEEFGTPQNALENLPKVAHAAGVKDYATCSVAEAEAEFARARKAGAKPLFLGTAPYPTLLAETSDAPPFLWAMGDFSLLDKPAIALVGARNASSLGVRTARLFAQDLGAAGFVVVSGLARGVDAAAHDAALPTGTIAVQAGGIDIVYPKENAVLFDKIAKQGLRLSEQPIGLQPMARHFPSRNRIISGLSRAT